MTRLRTLATLLLVAALVAPRGAMADDAAAGDKTEEARSYFNRGVESFRDGAYDAALVQFKAAYATAPNYRVLYNIGQTSLKLQEFASALGAFERYLTEGGTDLPPDRRSAVEQEVERLNRRVSRVSIATNVESGEVLVDDASVGRLPLNEGVRVSAGRRKIAIVPDGAAPIARVVDVPGGGPMRVELSTAGAPAAATAPRQSASPSPPPSAALAPDAPPVDATRVGAWIALGGGAALAVGAGVAGVLALGAKSDAEAELERYPGSRRDLDDARSRMKTSALACDLLGAAAVVAAGVGITLLVIDRGEPARAARVLVPARRASSADASIGKGQLRLRVRF